MSHRPNLAAARETLRRQADAVAAARGRPNADFARGLMAELMAAAGIKPTLKVPLVGEITPALEKQVRNHLDDGWAAGKVVLAIESPGGSARAGERIARHLEELAGCGVATAAHGVRLVASAAIQPYASANSRTADWSTRFLLHGEGGLPYGAGRLTAAALRDLSDRMRASDDAELALLRRRGVSLPADMVADYRAGGDVKISASLAQALGLVHQVVGGPRMTPANYHNAPPGARALIAAMRHGRL